MNFDATKAKVLNRGHPPDSYLYESVEWAKTADAAIFAPNPNPADIYALVRPLLGPWQNLLHRRAAMLEVMRVHAGFESSWNWNEDYDKSNPSSVPGSKRAETGIFQVSFDSTEIDNDAMKPFAIEKGIGTVGSFIPVMKSNHPLALEYYARLVRVSIAWAGPLKRHEIDPWLSKAAVQEFMNLLS